MRSDSSVIRTTSGGRGAGAPRVQLAAARAARAAARAAELRGSGALRLRVLRAPALGALARCAALRCVELSVERGQELLRLVVARRPAQVEPHPRLDRIRRHSLAEEVRDSELFLGE